MLKPWMLVPSLLTMGLLSFSGGQVRGQDASPAQPSTNETSETSTPAVTPRAPFPENNEAFADVDAQGQLLGGKSAFSSTKVGTGKYQVIFIRDVTACAYVASISVQGRKGTPTPGLIGVVGRRNVASGVFVTTTDLAGRFSDRPFQLLVSCNPET